MKEHFRKKLTKLTEKHLCWSLFFIRKRLRHMCVPVNFLKIFNKSFFYRTPLGDSFCYLYP